MNQGKMTSLPLAMLQNTAIDYSLTLFFLLSGLISYGLNSGNYQIIRFFEGYKFSKFFILFHVYHRLRQRNLKKKLNKISLNMLDSSSSLKLAELKAKYDMVTYRIEMSYPKSRRDIMPTKIGNVFRAFEDYPRLKYGIETIVIWPRLLLLLPDNTQRHLEDAQSSMMFFLVTSFLSYLFAIEAAIFLFFGIYSGWVLHTLLIFLVSAGLSGFFLYRIGIESAQNFGELVKAIFDLHRKNLLLELAIPVNEHLAREKKRWQQLSKFFLYRETTVDPFK